MTSSLPKDERQRREVIRRAARLAGLLENPSFQELERECERHEERIQKYVVSRVMSPDGADQREVDFQRGFLKGVRSMISVPYAAQGLLKKAHLEEEERNRNQEEEEAWMVES